MSTVPNGSDVAAACREHWGRLLALLVARGAAPSDAEDALQDAVEAALHDWPIAGVPRQPAAWLLTVARRRLVDRARAADVARRKQPLLAVTYQATGPDAADDALDAISDADLPDERLRLVLLCCHPDLTPEAQAALALRLVLGVPTSEVARLFLVPEPTMAARLTRAKQRLARSGVPFAAEAADLRGRLPLAVRAVHLAFSAGYAPGEGADLLRADLAGEAVRLARLLARLAPDDDAARPLLALVLLHHARRAARVDAAGELVLLADQDRELWRRDEIEEGLLLLASGTPASDLGRELDLQARIAALHDVAGSASDTDWAAIAGCYRQLERLTGNPVVRLNRAVAEAEAWGPERGLDLLQGLDEHLPRSHRLPAVRAELLSRVGRSDEAADAWRLALARCGNAAERRFLARRLAEAASHSGPDADGGRLGACPTTC